MIDPGQSLLELLQSWVEADTAGAFAHVVTIGVRTQDGFRYWTHRPGPSKGSPHTAAQPPDDSQVLVGLSRAYARSLVTGRDLSECSALHVCGDRAIWRAFVQRFVGGYDCVSLRGALADLTLPQSARSRARATTPAVLGG